MHEFHYFLTNTQGKQEENSKNTIQILLPEKSKNEPEMPKKDFCSKECVQTM